MRPFEYARPQTETEAVEMLQAHDGQTAVLAGGTDLMTLLKRDVVQPKRLVDIKRIDSLKGITPDVESDGVLVGALVTLEEALESATLAEHHSVMQVIHGHKAIQVQQNGTLIGDLTQLPHCWYYRNGYGLLAYQDGASLVEKGDNRYHAIFGNSGPAKFVSSSRFAPSMIAFGAKVRVVGPESQSNGGTEVGNGLVEEFIPLEYFYQTPKTDAQGVHALKPGQLITHLWLPKADEIESGAYEVLELNGLDQPQASAAVALKQQSGIVQEARIVLGHVAPTPWIAQEASRLLIGQRLTESVAAQVADVAVSRATPLSMNDFKVQMARASVKRALLRAIGKLDETL
jgi:xanthine dehydrogenase YagS FAD-binding subunit